MANMKNMNTLEREPDHTPVNQGSGQIRDRRQPTAEKAGAMAPPVSMAT